MTFAYFNAVQRLITIKPMKSNIGNHTFMVSLNNSIGVSCSYYFKVEVANYTARSQYMNIRPVVYNEKISKNQTKIQIVVKT